MTRFFDPLACPNCVAVLPPRSLRCPSCGIELTGPTVVALVAALRQADSLLDQMRAEAPTQAAPQLQASSSPPPLHVSSSPPRPVPRQDLPEVAVARAWFAGKSVGVILLVLGALCVLAAGTIFIAVHWGQLTIVVRGLILVLVTASFGLCARLALRRGLQATAEAMAAITCCLFVLDLTAARRAGLPGLADLAAAPYEILAGVLLVAAAGAGAFAVRSRQHWLWSLDAAIAFGMARAVVGVLRLPIDASVSTVTVTLVACLLYFLWRRLRLPVARWTALYVGGMTWLAAVAIGVERAADPLAGGDVQRLTQAWPALTMALVAGLGSTRLAKAVSRRVTACLCLLPALMVFEIVAWSHGWQVGAVLMLAGYAVAALASGFVSSSWSPAVGGSAAVLGLSAVAGLLPILASLAARLGLALDGSWPGSSALPPGLLTGDVGPWLLPLATLVLLALLPRVTIDNQRICVEEHHIAGAVVATLGVLPLLYGAGFWTSMTALVVVAAILLCGSRLWRHDCLLVLGLSLLAVVRVCAYYDDLADPLAWTLLGVACLAWALTERRPTISAGFLTAAGIFALFAAAQWLAFSRTPVAVHGLVIVAVGSLGLLASQRLRRSALTRMVSEGLSVTWLVVGLVTASSSPSHGALELTVVGVAAGVTAYLSQDRRPAGWVSGVLLTIASWIRLAEYELQAVEWYTLPAATALLVYGIRRLRLSPGQSSWRCLGPGLALGMTSSLVLALDEPVSWRALFVGLVSVALVAVGVRSRLAAPFAFGAVGTALLALRNIWPVVASIPGWTLLFVIGAALLAAGVTWEARVNDVRTASRYVRGLR